MTARWIRVRAVAVVAAVLAALLMSVVAAPTAKADPPGIVVIVVGEPTGSYITALCADPGLPSLGVFVCSDSNPLLGVQFLSGGSSATVTLAAGHYNTAMADGTMTALSPVGGVDVLAGQAITCTFTMAAGPSCVPGATTGTIIQTVTEPSGSFATGYCAAPGLPVALSSTCTDSRAVQGLQIGIAAGSTTSVSLLPGTYNAAMVTMPPTPTVLSPVVAVHVLAGQTLTCSFTIAAGPVCSADDGDGVTEPSGVDGNGDGTDDALQASVATFTPAVGSGLLTIAAPDDAYAITAVTNTGAPYTPAPPAGAGLPVGVLGFSVTLPTGASTADVDVILPAGTHPTTYYKLQSGSWLDYTSHVTIVGDTVTLHLVDGDAFDADGAVNGVIVDPGFPSNTYHFTGFAAPIANGKPNTVKAGQTVPVSWTITGVAGAPVSTPTSFVSLISRLCGGGDETNAATAGKSGLQYLGAGVWQFNWATSKAYKSQCRILTLTLDDGSVHTATFSFGS